MKVKSQSKKKSYFHKKIVLFKLNALYISRILQMTYWIKNTCYTASWSTLVGKNAVSVLLLTSSYFISPQIKTAVSIRQPVPPYKKGGICCVIVCRYYFNKNKLVWFLKMKNLPWNTMHAHLCFLRLWYRTLNKLDCSLIWNFHRMCQTIPSSNCANFVKK